MYHLVCPAKYRKKIFSEAIETTLKETCIEISKRYEIKFLEIGIDEDHVHFMVQSVPTISVTRIITIIKSITAREIYKRHKEVKKELWGGNIWTSGYYANTVGQYGNEEVIKNYVKSQKKEYKQLFRKQLSLFEE